MKKQMKIEMNDNVKQLIDILNGNGKSEDNEYKMVIAVRKDLNLPKGKLAVQVAHAAVDLSLKALKYMPEVLNEWLNSGAKKVVVFVNDEDEVWQLKAKCEDEGILSTVVRDAGRTVVEPGTVTCLGLGPDVESKIDKLTKNLKLV